MLPKFKNLSLEKQLFLSFFFVSACLLVLSLGISLFYNVNRRKAEIDSLISGVAAYAASMDQVIDMLDSGYPDRETVKALDGLHENFPDLNVIAIYDRDLLRFYHTTRRESGESLINGEEQAVLSGSGPYITTGIGTHGTQRRAFHAVLGKDGAISGFVMASAFSTYIAEQSRQIFSVYAAVLVVMLVVSFLLSHGTVRLLRSSLMGYHPQELLKLYLRQRHSAQCHGGGDHCFGSDRYSGLCQIRPPGPCFLLRRNLWASPSAVCSRPPEPRRS